MNIRCFCCMGDSITSDQVSGIGTMVAHRLNAQEVLNAACGYATCPTGTKAIGTSRL